MAAQEARSRFFLRPARRGAEVGGEADLVAPGQAVHPTGLLQEVRRRCRCVRDRTHHVATSVAIAVDREALECGGHELGMAEGAGPGASQRRGIDVAVLDDLQGRHQLAGEIGLTARRVAGQRGERLHQRPIAEILAEIRLDAPNARDHVAIDAETGFRLAAAPGPIAAWRRCHPAPAGRRRAPRDNPRSRVLNSGWLSMSSRILRSGWMPASWPQSKASPEMPLAAAWLRRPDRQERKSAWADAGIAAANPSRRRQGRE